MTQNNIAKPLPAVTPGNSKPVQAQNKPLTDISIPVPKKKAKSSEAGTPKSAQNNPLEDLMRFTPDDLVKGFVFSQILGEPRCRRRGWR